MSLKTIITLALLFVIVPQAWAKLPAGIPTKRGDFVSHYSDKYDSSELKWYSKFDIVIPGYFIPEDQIKYFHNAGCKLVWYDWLVAFYLPDNTPADDWRRTLLKEHPEYFINPDKPLYGNAGDSKIPAYYFDPAVKGEMLWRANDDIRQIKQHNYQGVFFDTVTFESVHPEAREMFKKKHHGVDYDACISDFLAELRKQWPQMIIFSNQGFRNHKYYLPYADHDLSESYMTSYAWAPEATINVQGVGKTKVMESYVAYWDNPDKPGNSIYRYCNKLINDPLKEYGYKTKICHLNFAHSRYIPINPGAKEDELVYKEVQDDQAICTALAEAYLFNQSSCTDPAKRYPPAVSDLYFIDLGKPVDSSYTYDQKNHIVWRAFENGFVVVNDAMKDKSFTLPAKYFPKNTAGLWDAMEKKNVSGFSKSHTVKVPADRYIATNRTVTTGRIYVYLKNKPVSKKVNK